MVSMNVPIKKKKQHCHFCLFWFTNQQSCVAVGFQLFIWWTFVFQWGAKSQVLSRSPHWIKHTEAAHPKGGGLRAGALECVCFPWRSLCASRLGLFVSMLLYSFCGYRGCSLTLALPRQSESSLLDRCPGVGKFIYEIFFIGRVELRRG